MTISIAITDGTDTVTLTATDGLLEAFVQQTPGANETSVTETIEVELIGGNAAVDANIAELERLFTRARERVNGAYGIDWVYIKITLDSAVWRSPIRDGRIVIGGEQWLKYERALGVRKANILITREAWWEDDTERQITLTNGNGTSGTTGINVYDCDDQAGTLPNKQQNYVYCDSLLGDLPAPVRMELALDGTTALYDLMISQAVYSSQLDIYWFEGNISAGSTTTAAGYSGGSYQSKSGTTITVTADITANTDKLKGGYYRVLARVSLEDGIAWKIRPLANAGVTVYGRATTLIAPPFSAGYWFWTDLGVIQVPPLYIPGQTWNQVLTGWVATCASSHAFALDCWQLSPLDGWKRIVLDSALAAGSLHIDEISGRVYAKNASAKIAGYGTSSGETLNVFPSVTQMFRFAWNSSDVSSSVSAYLIVKMFYRPRRRTL